LTFEEVTLSFQALLLSWKMDFRAEQLHGILIGRSSTSAIETSTYCNSSITGPKNEQQ
jgi:hypothetical protein